MRKMGEGDPRSVGNDEIHAAYELDTWGLGQ